MKNRCFRKEVYRRKRGFEFKEPTTVTEKHFTVEVEDTEAGEEIYDYVKFNNEYEQQIEQDIISSNKTLNDTAEEKPEEEPKEALKTLLDFKNCTEESKTFGVKAIDCLIDNYEREKDNPVVKRTLQKTWLIVKVWSLIYVCLAIPCWCQYGWSCCCFRFKFCFPRRRILFAKQYYADNPPGTLCIPVKKKKEEQQVITYEPTELELDMYENFEAAIRNL